MSPKRSDYRTRKEYRWAKKVEQRELLGAVVLSGRPLKAATILTGIVAFATLAVVAVVLPANSGGWGLTLIFVPIVVAVGFRRSKICRTLAKLWDDASERSALKAVERGDTSISGQWSAKVVDQRQKEREEVPLAKPRQGLTPSTERTRERRVANELAALSALKRAGQISDEEFGQAKAKLLGLAWPQHPAPPAEP